MIWSDVLSFFEGGEGGRKNTQTLTTTKYVKILESSFVGTQGSLTMKLL